MHETMRTGLSNSVNLKLKPFCFPADLVNSLRAQAFIKQYLLPRILSRLLIVAPVCEKRLPIFEKKIEEHMQHKIHVQQARFRYVLK